MSLMQDKATSRIERSADDSIIKQQQQQKKKKKKQPRKREANVDVCLIIFSLIR